MVHCRLNFSLNYHQAIMESVPMLYKNSSYLIRILAMNVCEIPSKFSKRLYRKWRLTFKTWPENIKCWSKSNFYDNSIKFSLYFTIRQFQSYKVWYYISSYILKEIFKQKICRVANAFSCFFIRWTWIAMFVELYS